jgi:hypothetical protein
LAKDRNWIDEKRTALGPACTLMEFSCACGSYVIVVGAEIDAGIGDFSEVHGLKHPDGRGIVADEADGAVEFVSR